MQSQRLFKSREENSSISDYSHKLLRAQYKAINVTYIAFILLMRFNDYKKSNGAKSDVKIEIDKALQEFEETIACFNEQLSKYDIEQVNVTHLRSFMESFLLAFDEWTSPIPKRHSPNTAYKNKAFILYYHKISADGLTIGNYETEITQESMPTPAHFQELLIKECATLVHGLQNELYAAYEKAKGLTITPAAGLVRRPD